MGLIRMFKEILHSSSTCSFDLDSSLRASIAGAEDLPPFSFWAAIISCLLISASSILFFFSSASAAFFFLGCHHFLSLDFCFFHPLFLLLSLSSLFFSLFLSDLFLLFSLFHCQCLLLGSFVPPLVDIVFQLFIEFILLHTLLPLCKSFISFHRSLRSVGQLLILVVRHDDSFVVTLPV